MLIGGDFNYLYYFLMLVLTIIYINTNISLSLTITEPTLFFEDVIEGFSQSLFILIFDLPCNLVLKPNAPIFKMKCNYVRSQVNFNSLVGFRCFVV